MGYVTRVCVVWMWTLGELKLCYAILHEVIIVLMYERKQYKMKKKNDSPALYIRQIKLKHVAMEEQKLFAIKFFFALEVFHEDECVNVRCLKVVEKYGSWAVSYTRNFESNFKAPNTQANTHTMNIKYNSTQTHINIT